jgi:hypothetical protein
VFFRAITHQSQIPLQFKSIMCKTNNDNGDNTTEWAKEAKISPTQDIAMTMEEFGLSSRALLRRMKQKLGENLPEWGSPTSDDETVCVDSEDEDDNSKEEDDHTKKQRELNDKTPRAKKTRNNKTHTDDSTTTAKMMTKAKEAIATVTEQQETELRDKQEKIIWRDFTFLSIALVLGCIMSFVEMNIADVEIRGGTVDDVSRGGVS